jgi:hypothetical protein
MLWPSRIARLLRLFSLQARLDCVRSHPVAAPETRKEGHKSLKDDPSYASFLQIGAPAFYLYLAGGLVGDDPQELLDAAIKRTIKRPGARQIDLPKDLTERPGNHQPQKQRPGQSSPCGGAA